MFMTSLNLAVGLVATAGLLSDTSAPEIIAAVHATAFVLAAPVAPAGIAFFVAVAVLAFATAVLPRWLAVASLLAALANLCALGGMFSLTGPLNSGNGLIGGIVAPILAWVLWILLVSLWWMRQAHPQRGVPLPAAPEPAIATVPVRGPKSRCAPWTRRLADGRCVETGEVSRPWRRSR